MTRRRALLLVAVAAMAWAAAVAITGGFVIDIGGARLSSRDPVRPLGLGLAVLIFYVARWRRFWPEDAAPLKRVSWSETIAAAATATALVTGLTLGTRIAGGPDASGYVSQAVLFSQGRLTITVPQWAQDAPWEDGGWSATPIGYRRTNRSMLFAPTYPPGLSLLMAAFHVAGGPAAVYFVVPVFGGLLIWATFMLGATVAGRWEGAIASALLACSPNFLSMLLQPMSDVPVAACWTLALLSASRHHSVRAGLAVALAVLIRPNLAPAAAVPALLLLLSSQARVRTLLGFAAPLAPAVALIAGLNWYYYGSPISTGYGTLPDIYSLDRVVPNLLQYGRWFVMTQTPLAALWILAPFVRQIDRPERPLFLVVLVGFPLVVLTLYLPYMQFQAFEWWYLRFLLPAYPSVLLGVSIVVLEASRRLPRALTVVVPALVVTALGWHGWNLTATSDLLSRRRGDARYARAVEYVRRLPPRAVIVSLAHSGTIRLYAGRDVLRFEVLRPADLDRAITYLRERDHPVYFVGDQFEVDLLRKQFPRSETVAALEGFPHVDLGGAVAYRLSATD